MIRFCAASAALADVWCTVGRHPAVESLPVRNIVDNVIDDASRYSVAHNVVREQETVISVEWTCFEAVYFRLQSPTVGLGLYTHDPS